MAGDGRPGKARSLRSLCVNVQAIDLADLCVWLEAVNRRNIVSSLEEDKGLKISASDRGIGWPWLNEIQTLANP